MLHPANNFIFTVLTIIALSLNPETIVNVQKTWWVYKSKKSDFFTISFFS